MATPPWFALAPFPLCWVFRLQLSPEEGRWSWGGKGSLLAAMVLLVRACCFQWQDSVCSREALTYFQTHVHGLGATAGWGLATVFGGMFSSWLKLWSAWLDGGQALFARGVHGTHTNPASWGWGGFKAGQILRFQQLPGTAAASWAVSIMHAPGVVVCFPLQHRNVHSNGLEIVTDPENKYVCVLILRAGTVQD